LTDSLRTITARIFPELANLGLLELCQELNTTIKQLSIPIFSWPDLGSGFWPGQPFDVQNLHDKHDIFIVVHDERRFESAYRKSEFRQFKNNV
jgi:hypothetical protein